MDGEKGKLSEFMNLPISLHMSHWQNMSNIFFLFCLAPKRGIAFGGCCGFAPAEKNDRTRKRRGKEKDRTLTEEERKRTGNLEKRKGIGKEERQGRVNREKQKEDERKKRGKGKRTERGKKKDRQYLTHTHISKPESFICKNIQKHKNGI